MLRGVICGAMALIALACGLAAPADTGASPRSAPPPFEWWANGKPPTPPLYLALESSRELCTAGTLTEISWEIAGGTPPYTLSIGGETVDADAGSHRINCGALTEAEADDADTALAAKQITATVTDSRGVQREVSLDVARARPLPAPTDFGAVAYRTYILSSWMSAEGKGPGVERSYILRWRERGSAQWTFTNRSFTSNKRTPARQPAGLDSLSEATVYELSAADTRTAIEGETPEALNWTPIQTVTTLTAPTNVRATATHDTITVRWEPQLAPGVLYTVYVSSLDGGAAEDVWLTPTDRHEVTLRGLPPDTEHRVSVAMEAGDQGARAEAPSPIRTLPAPADWTAPVRGVQNVRAAATHNSITVWWDPPRADALPLYIVHLFRALAEGEGPEGVDEVKVWHFEVFDETGIRIDDLDPSTTYRVLIYHPDAVIRNQEITVSTTAAPSASGASPRSAPPPFEWWANGRPPTPLLYLKLTSSRDVCTAGTLTEISWEISGGTAPYMLSVEGKTVDVDADNIRINCGALPTDPRTGELAASRTKTFRGSVRDSRGVTTTATTLVTLTTPPYLAADTALRYETYDLTGAAASAGSYAFLTDATGAASAVTTYEGLRDGSAGALLIHTSDAQGTPQRSLYAAVATGDLFEWRESYDCWVRYRVTEVRPDPPGAAARKLFGVERTTYAFTGCSGSIATDAAVLLAWGPLPDLGGPTLAAPLVHGPYQLIPTGWRGVTEEPRSYLPSAYSATNPTYTRDLAAARRLPYWRDPDLPAGWTFAWATAGDVSGPTYGYWAVFASERGGHGVTIFGYYADYRGHPEESSWLNDRGVLETRIIAGRPARVMYSPPGPSHDDWFPVTVWVYDSLTEAEYMILGKVKSLRGDNVDAVIAIARSLFEEADAP